MAVCNDDFVQQNRCNKSEIGEYIIAANATEKSRSLILTKLVDLKDPKPIKYPIKKTGYYCLFTERFTVNEYQAATEWRNAYGELSATQIPKLPFYGGITVVYALLAGYWGFLYYQHRHDIRKLRKFHMLSRQQKLTCTQWPCKTISLPFSSSLWSRRLSLGVITVRFLPGRGVVSHFTDGRWIQSKRTDMAQTWARESSWWLSAFSMPRATPSPSSCCSLCAWVTVLSSPRWGGP